jgi:hypothetical protein
MNQSLWLEWHSANQHVQKLDTPRLQIPTKCMTKGGQTFVQTIRGLQKKLLCHIEAEIKATIPSKHVVVQWVAMNASWLYNRNNAHSTLKVVPYQNLWGRPYQGKVVSFGQTLFPRFGPNQRRRNTNLLGDAAHGWARTLLTMILSAQMDNSSCAQRLSERFPTNGTQNYFLE